MLLWLHATYSFITGYPQSPEERHFAVLQLLSLSSSIDFLPLRKNKGYGSKLLKGPQSCGEVRQKAGLCYLLSSSSFLIQKKGTVRTASFPSL